MAIVKMNESRSASCKFISGVDGEGNEMYMTRTIAKFKTDSSLEDVNEIVFAIGSLYPYGIKTVNLTERCELDEA